jgi:hypothetical protein
MTTEPEPALLHVVRGTPDDVELAALTAVVSAIVVAAGLAGGSENRPHWSSPRTLVRRPIGHGPGAWHASGLPG